jgi:hypothetical protein
MAQQSFEKTQSGRQKARIDFRDEKKHYVRVNGWLPVVSSYKRETRGRVRYLTLCGKEAIDVRYFAQKGVLQRNDSMNEYPDLTFIEADDEDYAIIAETLGRVRLSLRARLEDALLNPNHISHKDLVSSFPYHVLNLDFCGSIVPKDDHPFSETLQCIDKVVELQAGAGAMRWHLFLTFRAQRSRANEEANNQLCAIVNGNLDQAEARQAYGDRPPPNGLLENAYPEFLRLSIAKFLANCAMKHNCAVHIESTWIYSRNEGEYHIVKLVVLLSLLRHPQRIPNPHAERGAYKNAVEAIFGSRATDVDREIEAAAEATQRDLRPVLDELERLGIVTA